METAPQAAGSNQYSKDATQTLLPVTNSHPSDWVSVSWPEPQRFGRVDVFFAVDANNQLPASVAVSYWNGFVWVPVSDQHVTFAGASDAPSTITFQPVSTTKVKVDMTSRSPNDPVTGNLTITKIEIPGDVVR